MNKILNNIHIILPDNINSDYLQGFGGLYCILEMKSWEMYSHTTRKEHKPVFCNISDDGKLYESEVSALRAAEKLCNDSKLQLCITYYGFALSAYFKTSLLIRGHSYEQSNQI